MPFPGRWPFWDWTSPKSYSNKHYKTCFTQNKASNPKNDQSNPCPETTIKTSKNRKPTKQQWAKAMGFKAISSFPQNPSDVSAAVKLRPVPAKEFQATTNKIKQADARGSLLVRWAPGMRFRFAFCLFCFLGLYDDCIIKNIEKLSFLPSLLLSFSTLCVAGIHISTLTKKSEILTVTTALNRFFHVSHMTVCSDGHPVLLLIHFVALVVWCEAYSYR